MTTENQFNKNLPISLEELKDKKQRLESINVEIGTIIEITPEIRDIIGTLYKDDQILARKVEILGENLFKIEFVFPEYNLGKVMPDHVSIVQMQLAIIQGIFMSIGLGIRQHKVNSPMSYETFLLNRKNVLYRRDQRIMRKKVNFNERCHLIFKLREPIKKGNTYCIVIDLIKDKNAFLDGWVEGLIQDEYLFDEREKANFKDIKEDKETLPNTMAGNVLTRFEANQNIKETIDMTKSSDSANEDEEKRE